VTRDRGGAGATLARQAARGLPQSGAVRRVARPAPADQLAARAAAENFPVALRLLPRRHRDHLAAIYNFARTVDDVGDECEPAERLPLLAELDADLGGLSAGQRSGATGAQAQASRPMHPAVRGLAAVVADCQIPMALFHDLITANKQDQVVSRYETFDDLLGYCRFSANPVGRIVLHVFGCSTPQRAVLSDSICSGLQIIEHLQDVAEDHRAGRIYLPAADIRKYGCTEQDLMAASASPQLRRLIAAEAERARALIVSGSPLVGELRGAARIAVAGYIAGGRAALAALASADYDVLARMPRPARVRTVLELVSALARGR